MKAVSEEGSDGLGAMGGSCYIAISQLGTQQRSSPSMPHPKSTPEPRKHPSASKDVIPLGRRDVHKNSGAGRPETFKERPTTTKALVLRNGKHGAMGTGELVLLSKIGGREKLDLLAGTPPVTEK